MDEKKLVASTRKFAEEWKDRGDEKSETHAFWIALLRDVCGVEEPEKFIQFEKRVGLEHKSFIDVYIPQTRVIIEQKTSGVELDKAQKQSDGTSLTPFEQAKRYSDWLPYSERARWIIASDFQSFQIYDMESPRSEPDIVLLKNLSDEDLVYNERRKLEFLANVKGTAPKDIKEIEISIDAGKLAGKLHDALLKRYVNSKDESTLRSLNIFCVRIVFLLYAEDSGLFNKNQFHDYLKAHKDSSRRALMDLFSVLNTEESKRDIYLDADLKAFPYVNGGLFEEQGIEIPNIDGEPLKIILDDMSDGFNWRKISPTIFGAAFESTLNSETRRTGGMHYTSIENIHRVIDPLFLNDLNTELEDIFRIANDKKRKESILAFQEKLSKLTFLDPACGSGNFLTETYLSLRRLENKILKELDETGQIKMIFSAEESPVKVSINQFYGIEINDFAVAVARTALWIAEAQMMEETQDILKDFYSNFLPLKTYNNIVEGSALKIDWNTVIPKESLNYIMGNPPFVGYSLQTQEQKDEIAKIYVDETGNPYKSAGKIDYVAAWYFKAAEFMQDTKIRAAFVSTNSITQGEQVSYVWRPLFNRFGIDINFAWRTLKWNSESTNRAQVHVVIIGFSNNNAGNFKRRIYDDDKVYEVANINPYLIDSETIFIEPRLKPLCDVPEMCRGSQPTDDGN